MYIIFPLKSTYIQYIYLNFNTLKLKSNLLFHNNITELILILELIFIRAFQFQLIRFEVKRRLFERYMVVYGFTCNLTIIIPGSVSFFFCILRK